LFVFELEYFYFNFVCIKGWLLLLFRRAYLNRLGYNRISFPACSAISGAKYGVHCQREKIQTERYKYYLIFGLLLDLKTNSPFAASQCYFNCAY